MRPPATLPGWPVRLGGLLSSSPLIVDLDGDGRNEVVVGGGIDPGPRGLLAGLKGWGRLWVLDGRGRPLPGWPVAAPKPFASSPAVGDLTGEGRLEVVVGCDDGQIYAFDHRGRPLPGWPVATGRDVYSSPALADLDGDGHPEVVVGSDDGQLWALDRWGRPLEGWPVDLAREAASLGLEPARSSQVDESRTGRLPPPFVSASPAVGDIDGDGHPEVVVGAWDRRVWALRPEGTVVAGWPAATGQVVWSSALLADLDGDGGLEVAVAADKFYLLRGDGSPQPGWPRPLASYAVASPALVDLEGEGRAALLVGADRLYAYQADGRPLEGFPAPGGSYLWSSPVVTQMRAGPLVLAGGWDGGLWGWDRQGRPAPGFPLATGGRLFATPAVGPLGEAGAAVVAASWDGRLYAWELGESKGPGEGAAWPCFRGGPRRQGRHRGRLAPLRPSPPGPDEPTLQNKGTAPPRLGSPRLGEAARPLGPGPPPPGRPRHRRPVAVSFPLEGPPPATATLHYRLHNEADYHPMPLVFAGGRLHGLFQPLALGSRVEYWVELAAAGDASYRHPPATTFSYLVGPKGLAPLAHRLRLAAGR